jgi:hypothetical protein
MSRKEKLAFAKRLKEERKALYVELGLDDEPTKLEDPRKPGSVQKPKKVQPPPVWDAALNCLGFVLKVAVERVPDEDTSEASDKAAEAAKAAFARGHKCNEGADFAGARSAFLEAHGLQALPQYLLSAANMSVKLGDFAEAKELYIRLDSGSTELSEKIRTQLRVRLADPKIANAPTLSVNC